MDLAELQDVIERTYGERDRDRGTAPSVAWLAEVSPINRPCKPKATPFRTRAPIFSALLS